MKCCLSKLTLLAILATAGLMPAPLSAADPPAANQLVEALNLNQATAAQLQTLPGVGPALSERIVKYRTEHGPFRTVDQLTEVKGIGQAKLVKFKDQLTVD